MKAYKGFTKDMKCRGFQFEEGKTYEEKEAELCKSGFHACEKPLDVFGYYGPANSIYHEVELENVDPRREDDSKICAKRIKIGAKRSISDLVKADVAYTLSKIDKTKAQQRMTGNCSASTNTGNRSASNNTGNGVDEYMTWSDVPKDHWAYYEIVEAANDHEYTPDFDAPLGYTLPEHWEKCWIDARWRYSDNAAADVH